MASLSSSCCSAVRLSSSRASVTLRPRAPRTVTVRASAGLGGLKGAKHVKPQGAQLGCPDSESGMCDHVSMRAHDALLGSPESVTGMVSMDFDALESDATPRASVHKAGGHIIHSEPAIQAMGCPESETGMCEVMMEQESEGPLGAWDF